MEKGIQDQAVWRSVIHNCPLCNTAGGRGGGRKRPVPCRAVPPKGRGGGGRKWSVPRRAVVFVPNKGRPVMEANKD